jgi:FlaA1/EpsC-like NDP-sugar epimerase
VSAAPHQPPNPSPSRLRARSGFRTRLRRAARARIGALARGNRIWEVVADSMLVAFAWWLAFYVRFDTGTPAFYERAMFETVGYIVLIKLSVFVVTGMYVKWWRYVTFRDMEGVLRSIVLASLCVFAYLTMFPPLEYVRIPRSVLVFDFVFTLLLVAGVRVLVRSLLERPHLRTLGPRLTGNAESTTVIVAGAGEAGRLLLSEMQRQQVGLDVVGLVDDDDTKQHMRLNNVPVLGTTADLPQVLADSGASEVVMAMPSAPGAAIQRIVDSCRDSQVRCRILPSLNELVLGDAGNLASRLREVQVEDVLGRDPVHVDIANIASYLANRVVLVTGAGGSIGSELCRQIAKVGPSLLVLVDNGEHNLFCIEQELITERGFDRVVPVLADVTSEARMRTVFDQHKPTVVFHAAAYKHVGMMETNPAEAVRNNAIGTRIVCDAAERAGVERFVLVSTDKAVEPKTVMGQSKALAEWVVQSFAARSFHTRFMAVRFGNVLGSSGSVVPIFRRQIERGGPVRVTDERMTRFFMTIPEAAQLIVQAGAIGDGGEVFVLDMGTPVKIVDLARNMIELSGLTPGEDIQIEIVGIRPGEKLHEELWAGDEQPEPTSHNKIFRSRSTHELDPDGLLEELESLATLCESGDAPGALDALRAIMQPRIDAGAHSALLPDAPA